MVCIYINFNKVNCEYLCLINQKCIKYNVNKSYLRSPEKIG